MASTLLTKLRSFGFGLALGSGLVPLACGTAIQTIPEDQIIGELQRETSKPYKTRYSGFQNKNISFQHYPTSKLGETIFQPIDLLEERKFSNYSSNEAIQRRWENQPISFSQIGKGLWNWLIYDKETDSKVVGLVRGVDETTNNILNSTIHWMAPSMETGVDLKYDGDISAELSKRKGDFFIKLGLMKAISTKEDEEKKEDNRIYLSIGWNF